MLKNARKNLNQIEDLFLRTLILTKGNINILYENVDSTRPVIENKEQSFTENIEK